MEDNNMYASIEIKALQSSGKESDRNTYYVGDSSKRDVRSISLLDRNPCYGHVGGQSYSNATTPDATLHSCHDASKVAFHGSRTFSLCWCLCLLVVVLVVGGLACAGISIGSWTASKLDKNNELLANLNQSNKVLQERLDNLNKCFLSFFYNNLNCTLGKFSMIPASSCSVIYMLHLPSDYYWVRSSNGSAVCVYCDMTRSCGGVTGGWRRVASLNFTNISVPCSADLRYRVDSEIRTCGINSTTAGCSSVVFHTGGISYSRVCGMVKAYQVGTVDAFGVYGRNYNITIDSNYVDGVSLTHGTSPRTHIWTFAAASNDVRYPQGSCQCVMSNHQNVRQPPLFISDDYFCDSLATEHVRLANKFYDSDPLWDGAGCSVNNTCCSLNNPPWFYKQLPSATTEDIEMRVCSDEGRDNEDIALSQVEIFVQ